MSAIAAIYNVPASSEEFLSWSFAHAAHHADIVRVIHQKTGRVLNSYVLDPLNVRDEDARQLWGYLHQQMHQEMDFAMGISGFDLTEVPWQDREAFAQWIYQNATEHYQAANTLNIG